MHSPGLSSVSHSATFTLPINPRLFTRNDLYDDMNLKDHFEEDDLDSLGVPYACQALHYKRDVDDLDGCLASGV